MTNSHTEQQPSYFPDTNRPNYLLTPYSFTTAQVHGLITPISQPCYGEPFNHEALSTLDDPVCPYPDPYAFLDEFRAETNPEYSAAYSPSSTAPYPTVSYSPFETSNQHQHDQQTYTSQQFATTAPPSPSQEDNDSNNKSSPVAHVSKVATAEELVGMGIYDPPTPAAASYLFGGQGQYTGKGLKLEETFEPSLIEDDEDGEGEHDEEYADAL
ncbi:hypothetical protein UCRPC4_g00764 [Phaeomoniella chlamydospora]|uniref:Uncharacterized protein n=1 Tax=Phaeomoniella chlamydospora TaxID=158046 RepID=A0A0G2HHM7_PHACM|nr:hypothetical protein UCRPC4_g00764 [Phaeomoniella chlamydospora]